MYVIVFYAFWNLENQMEFQKILEFHDIPMEYLDVLVEYLGMAHLWRTVPVRYAKPVMSSTVPYGNVPYVTVSYGTLPYYHTYP
jgi:hypothetical protein